MAGLGWRKSILLILGYCLVFAIQTSVTRQVFTTRFPGGNDFYPRWRGGCRLLRQGADPYSDETTLAIQRGIYGRPARPDEDQVAFAYPLHTLAFIWPTCFLRDFATVQAAWMTATVHLVLAATALMKAAAGWRGAGGLWLATLAWSVFVYPNARAILLGQMAVVVFFALALALWALTVGRDALAGGALSAATIKPQFSFLVIAWLLLWSAGRGRRKVLISFGVVLLALTSVSLALQPNWIGSWLAQLARYPSYTELGSGLWIMTTYYLGTPRAIEWLLAAGLLLLLLQFWVRSRRGSLQEMLWVAGLTLLVTHFVSPRTATTHFGVLVLPLFLLFERWREDRPRSAPLAIGITLALTLVGSWLLFLLTVEGDRESALNYLPMPLLLLSVILLRRRQLVEVEREQA